MQLFGLVSKETKKKGVLYECLWKLGVCVGLPIKGKAYFEATHTKPRMVLWALVTACFATPVPTATRDHLPRGHL